MGQKASENLDESTPTRSDQSAVRGSFRVAVEPEDGIVAVLDGTTYPVADISPEGINVFCRDNSCFTQAQVLENCELVLPKDTIKGLTAKVVHSSFGTEGQWTHGIQWVGLLDGDLEKIVDQVSKIKNRLLHGGEEPS